MTAAAFRIVLVETSPLLPGLLPFGAWDAIATADVVLLRDRAQHPTAAHLYFAGIDLEELTLGEGETRGLDLLGGGTFEQRRLARALVDRAAAAGSAVYLMDGNDHQFGQLVGVEAAKRGDGEVEFVFLPPMPRGSGVLRLVDVERQLRDPDGGCPWDLEQDHTSLVRYLVEETYELVEAIEDGTDADVLEELGDVLLQVVFHAQIAADRGAFDIDGVAEGIADKLVRRHPHVFGDADVADADEVKANWEVLKQQEKQRTGPFEGVPGGLPGLMLAWELQRKAAAVGFDWEDPGAPRDRILQELDELSRADGAEEREEELGDLLGAVVGLARHLDVEPERAMRRAARKFAGRFEAVLAAAEERGLDPAALDREAWLALWDAVKDVEDR